MTESAVDVIERIVEQNLAVYRASLTRLREDVNQEAQVAHDYRGRLVYELLQNADDAMEDQAAGADRVAFRITDDSLWVMNSGRPLTAADVEGLCGLGASSKVDVGGRRRASIGHKGLGFKSVLEITDRPAIYSRSVCFELGAQHAGAYISDSLGLQPPRVPAMRFPVMIPPTHPEWRAHEQAGFNTAFHFPLRSDLGPEHRRDLADLLAGLPVTAILFLKHLGAVEVIVNQAGRSSRRHWAVARERFEQERWQPVPSLSGTGLFRVRVNDRDRNEASSFLLAHDADVEIGDHRDGLDGPAWEGVEVTEVSVASLEPGSGDMPAEWRRFHVFLPTEQACPYPLLVNGAFATDLSRQHVAVSQRPNDYNAHLIKSCAVVFAEALAPALLEHGSSAVLAVLDRGAQAPDDGAAALLHDSLTSALAGFPLLPTEAGDHIALAEAVVPPEWLGDAGSRFRSVLHRNARWEDHEFPDAAFCAGRWARIAHDHGATRLSGAACITVLARLADPDRSSSYDHPSGAIEIDPVLEVCEILYERAVAGERREIQARVRKEPLFPVSRDANRVLTRVALASEQAFFPPQSATRELPLTGLRFLCHELCWGALRRTERNTYVETKRPTWVALFDIQVFGFDEVMRAAVLPALRTDVPTERRRRRLCNLDALSAICQLAGSSTKADHPLRYQRLGSDGAFFPLSRLPVPCRGDNGTITWVPAFRVYFGSDWIGDRSIEHVVDGLPEGDPSRAALTFPFLAPPATFLGRLAGFDTPSDGVEESVSPDDDFDVDGDADRAMEGTERGRWLAFLSWIGVNRALRPVHFHDVDDAATGWLHTRGLTKPSGWAFAGLGSAWDEFRDSLQGVLSRRPDITEVAPYLYLYQCHDLEAIDPLLSAAREDASSGVVAQRLFGHLADHWSFYSGFTNAKVAIVRSRSPGGRRPAKAYDEELVDAGDDFWLFRLSRAAFCPTRRGPRSPGQTWLPSEELRRRFPQSRPASHFLPVLAMETEPSGVRQLALRLGIRAELSASTFGTDDAAALCEQIKELYHDQPIEATQLRSELRPIYRDLFELLAGRSREPGMEGVLAHAPLLAETVDGWEFRPAREVFYVETPGLRERSGIGTQVPIFVLEADPAATAALKSLFNVRTVEDALDWQPVTGGPAFPDADDEEVFRSGLRQLAPSVLARIRADRPRERDRDLVVLRAFIERVEPVDELSLTCRLDGASLSGVPNRGYFVGSGPPAEKIIYVTWEGRPWPPATNETAGNLAMALADALGVNLVETFLTFIQNDDAQRMRLLDMVGGRGLLDEATADWADERMGLQNGEPEQVAEPGPTPPPPDDGGGGGPAFPPAPPPAPPRAPLRRLEDLCFEGIPVTEYLGRASGGESDGGGGQGPPGRPGPSGVDVAELDQLGMQIVFAYERRRLEREGCGVVVVLPNPEIVSPSLAGTLVVDVSNPAKVQRAEEQSEAVEAAFVRLRAQQVSHLYPGFDVLTIRDGEIDRLIELKSSGRDSLVTGLSWNEWKSARRSEVRRHFWLYLAGNLRADIGVDAVPFLRAIHDPFGSLIAETVEESRLERAVQLRVREFTTADYLPLVPPP